MHRPMTLAAVFLLLCISCTTTLGQVNSETDGRLREALKTYPDADTDGDGILTLEEARSYRQRLAAAEVERPLPQRDGALPAGRQVDPAALTAIKKTGDGLWVGSTGHSLVGPAMTPLEAIAKAAGYEGHLQICQLSGGASGSPRAHWEKPDAEQRMKAALATGKLDVLTMGIHLEGSEVEDIARWIELGLQHNPDMVFYLQDAWPRLYALLPEGKEPATPTLDAYKGEMSMVNAIVKEKVDALGKRFPGKVRVIPVGNAMVELVERFLAGNLPGVDAIFIDKKEGGERISLYRDSIHPSSAVAALEGYIYFACLYKRNPAELAAGVFDDPKLDPILREVAWKVVTEHPLSGVTAKAAGREKNKQ
jgi:hypothetical protein